MVQTSNTRWKSELGEGDFFQIRCGDERELSRDG